MTAPLFTSNALLPPDLPPSFWSRTPVYPLPPLGNSQATTIVLRLIRVCLHHVCLALNVTQRPALPLYQMANTSQKLQALNALRELLGIL
jgi:hypothetical protein